MPIQSRTYFEKRGHSDTSTACLRTILLIDFQFNLQLAERAGVRDPSFKFYASRPDTTQPSYDFSLPFPSQRLR